MVIASRERRPLLFPNAREIKAFAARQSQLLSGRIVVGEKRLPRFLVKVTALEYFDYA